MNPFVVIIYGNPGSGKSTQANQVADHFGLEHFNTGKMIEGIVHDEARQGDPIVQRERRLFDGGFLNTPEWVTEMVKVAAVDLKKINKGVVFSGSPRTLYEAGKLIPLLEELYGKNNVFVFEIKVKPETAIFRNSKRRICEKCDKALIHTPESERLTACPSCGGNLVTRTLDVPKIITVRLKEYTERTAPILHYLKERELQVIEIDGEPSPEEVTTQIFNKLPVA